MPSYDQADRAIRLVEYLLRLASLRTRLVRDIADYEKVLWISDVPHQKGCFARTWGIDEAYDLEIWTEVQNRKEPEIPSAPELCRDWIDHDAWRNKSDIPGLLPEITRQHKNPEWIEGSEQLEFIAKTEHLYNYPEVQSQWEQYVEARWMPWVDTHNDWEAVHGAYSALFAIHQEQLRLGEEYELVLALGLLTWVTPTNQRVRRHLLVANALLEFEPRLGRFTVRANPEGANIRAELDMLDIEDQPIKTEEMANSELSSSSDDPWDKDCTEGVLKALVHSLNSQGEYQDNIAPRSVRATDKPVVEYAPALILRKRSAKGLTEVLKRIKVRIESGEMIPSEFADLAEIKRSDASEIETDTSAGDHDADSEVFFPKPSNDEQRRIVNKISVSNGVLVQGPPGTGKSHTIANLICHLLATGQRILVTAKTPRALQVLEGLVPEELRPLCINLLGSGLEEKRSLESSVSGILRTNEEWEEKRALVELGRLESNLRQLRAEKASVDRKLRAIRESETYIQTIGQGAYVGTAAQLATAVGRDRNSYGWFVDAVRLGQECPFQSNDLAHVIDALRRFSTEERNKLNLAIPSELPSPEYIFELLEKERNIIIEESRLAEGADERIADHLSKVASAAIQSISNSLSELQRKRKRLLESPHPWVKKAVNDVLVANVAVWSELRRVTQNTVNAVEALVSIADETAVQAPEAVEMKTLLDDSCKLQKHLQAGGRLGWGPFKPRIVRELRYLLKSVRVNGQRCNSLEYIVQLINALRVRSEFDKVWGFWIARCDRVQGPFALQLLALKSICEVLDETLALESLLGQCRTALGKCPSVVEPSWTNELSVDTIVASCQLAMAQVEKRSIEEQIQAVERPILPILAGRRAHPAIHAFLDALRNRNVDSLNLCFSKILEVKADRIQVQQLGERLEILRKYAPMISEELEQSFAESVWDSRVKEIRNAWYWAEARTYVEDYLQKEDAHGLATRAKQIEDQINFDVTRISSLRAWSFCFSRLTEDHRRNMEAWQQSMRRLGKGTGKHAPKHRRDAQLHLNKCREAVPAWVMPLHRVWDTVEPAPEIFDLIIVDEASQCGFEALPLLYLGKKILIVGDDKQISPDAVGLPRDAMFRLMAEFLHDFEYKSSFDIEGSLFDHGKLRYGRSRITLREHFRCMPEIIRFSNDLCYRDTPLIPLRQYGPDRLDPLKRVFVDRGHRQGENNRVVNLPEADAVAEKIVELCKNPRYRGKTMGVVVLQGDEQGKHIENRLLSLLGSEEMDKRRLVCGNSYSFQGDQRDIIFLSMVAAPNERIGALTKPPDERRFNVAASRARDQMWLFHSARREDLSTNCLRRKMLEFFEGTAPQAIGEIDRDELERRAFQDNRAVVNPPKPFESWFEVDVALEILRRDYHIVAQFDVAGKRIDLVIEGGHARLAVECDGDKWHGADDYEKDAQRQRMLERSGWEFFRIRESAFRWNRDVALGGLWRLLEERDILSGPLQSEVILEEDDIGGEPNGSDEEDSVPEVDDNGHELSLFEDMAANDGRSRKRPDQVSASEIQDAIIQSLRKCPNRTCTLQSLTSRVLRELGVLTRGNPRLEFEKRVMRNLSILETEDIIERYRAKNRRVRLLNY